MLQICVHLDKNFFSEKCAKNTAIWNINTRISLATTARKKNEHFIIELTNR